MILIKSLFVVFAMLLLSGCIQNVTTANSSQYYVQPVAYTPARVTPVVVTERRVRYYESGTYCPPSTSTEYYYRQY
jgi:hypothetical protein